MGVSGKWIKALVGRKKSEKPDSLEKDGIGNFAQEFSIWKLRKYERATQGSGVLISICEMPLKKVSKFHDQRKDAVEFDDGKLPNEFDSDAIQPIGENIGHSNSDAHYSPSTSQQAHGADHNHQMREECAAIRIQTAFRGFLTRTVPFSSVIAFRCTSIVYNSLLYSLKLLLALNSRARRALRALKGVVKLQALVRGYVVRKQAAITLRCMQALVRVQARVRARHVRMSLETQAAQQKFRQKPAVKIRVREIEEGWCDSVGSVEDVQTKILKRQEAAAKRERAMAYALANQWQAGSRQQPVLSGFEPDKSSWGWNWLERWMAVRPWENRFVDINLRDGVMIHESGAKDGQNGTAHQLRAAYKKPFSSNTYSYPESQRAGPILSNGCDSSPALCKSEGLVESLDKQPVKPNSTGNVENAAKETNSKPGIETRSHSNPRERTSQADKQTKKRLSLPNNGSGPGSQTARLPIGINVKGKLSTQKASRDKPKLNRGKDVNITKPDNTRKDIA
ncbi:hypothetical protein Fmac_005393 [Flemingia macrophylla]|uniref:Protein IQ-DOMAIN 1 n=1 Tax=Flemingia macrophylla TaxID=520843 RepID=A0ABD1N804_9FABA